MSPLALPAAFNQNFAFSCSVVSAENGYTMKVKDAASRSPADTLQRRTLAISDDENDGGSCT
jgi:hypothetical protein